MKIILLGLSHKTAPVEIREKLNFDSNTLKSALTHFDTNHSQAHLEDVREGVIVSTCNRMEVYAMVHDREKAVKGIIKILSRTCETPPDVFAHYLYVKEDAEAVDHLFRVAAGLDSMVLGEPQILGQVTDAYEAALSQRAAGTVLSKLFTTAIHTGKRARTETRISVNASSISSVAAGLANELLGDLAQRRVLLIGAGEMGAVAVRALRKRGVSNITVANRTFRNAEALAQEWNGKAITFQQIPETLVHTDIVITSTGAPHTILSRRLLEPVVRQRGPYPLFLIDIAVPRDIDPDVTELPHVYLRDIDDLQGQADNNVEARRAEVPHVEYIVEQEADCYMAWFASLDVVSTITDLRRQVEELRQRELQLLFNRLDLDEREQELVRIMSHRLVNKILHQPTLRLKDEAANGNGAAYVSVLRDLFLNPPPAPTNGNGHFPHPTTDPLSMPGVNGNGRNQRQLMPALASAQNEE
jgi:glutamyl-tRNA reductase